MPPADGQKARLLSVVHSISTSKNTPYTLLHTSVSSITLSYSALVAICEAQQVQGPGVQDVIQIELLEFFSTFLDKESLT